MARVFQRPGDGNWWLDYTAQGRRRRVRTTTTSKRAAENLLAEVRAGLMRQGLGLEVVPVSQVRTVGEAWLMWLDKWCPEASKLRERSRFNANVKDTRLAGALLTEVTGDHLEAWFASKAKERSSSTVNGHRRVLRRIFNCLIRKRLFRGVNPVKETKPLDEVPYAHETLTEAEMRRLLPHVPASWRDFVLLAFLTGLRRGELFALRRDRTVVDLEAAILTPRGSNTRQVTKGRAVRSVPLLPEAVEILQRAWDAAEPGGLLFPGPDGKMRSLHSKTSAMMKRAMAAAGMVDGWRHVCRWGCRGVVEAADEQQRPCPSCGRILWPKPVVRNVRFHDVRHSTATHLLDNGVPLDVVQLMLRHSSLAITEKIYRHRTVEKMRGIVAATTRSPAALLEQMATAAESPEVAAALRQAAEKLAPNRHHLTVVQLPVVTKGR